MRGLAGTTAVLTGGAHGIGAATALRLGGEGVAVVIGDLDGPGADKVAAEIRAAGGRALGRAANLRDEDSLRALADAAAAEFGGIDLLVNNAGQSFPGDGTVIDTTDKIWDRTWDINLMGYVRTCRVVIPHMLERGAGSIVNIASGSGTIGTKDRIAYGTAKAGIIQLTRNIMAAHSRRGIRCNAICPGMIATPGALSHLSNAFIDHVAAQVPLGRVGTPDDIAGLVAYLLSADAAYVTGQVIHADGGVNTVGPSGAAE